MSLFGITGSSQNASNTTTTTTTNDRHDSSLQTSDNHDASLNTGANSVLDQVNNQQSASLNIAPSITQGQGGSIVLDLRGTAALGASARDGQTGAAQVSASGGAGDAFGLAAAAAKLGVGPGSAGASGGIASLFTAKNLAIGGGVLVGLVLVVVILNRRK